MCINYFLFRSNEDTRYTRHRDVVTSVSRRILFFLPNATILCKLPLQRSLFFLLSIHLTESNLTPLSLLQGIHSYQSTFVLMRRWMRWHIIVEEMRYSISSDVFFPTKTSSHLLNSSLYFHKHDLLELLAYVASRRFFRTRSWIGDKEIVSWFKTRHWLLARKWKVQFMLLQILPGGPSVWTSNLVEPSLNFLVS